VTWIRLVVGIWVIAVVLTRRLPRPGAQGATSTNTTCPSCAKSIPGGTKFCPECGASTATAKS
jgi:predicted amidophosphoribosyltransferase